MKNILIMLFTIGLLISCSSGKVSMDEDYLDGYWVLFREQMSKYKAKRILHSALPHFFWPTSLLPLTLRHLQAGIP